MQRDTKPSRRFLAPLFRGGGEGDLFSEGKMGAKNPSSREISNFKLQASEKLQ
jgi:hypothetical protein